MIPQSPSSRVLVVCLALSVLSLVSCQSKDADRLAALGSRLGEKARELLAPGTTPLSGLQSVPLRLGDLSVDARVWARLKWDKTLAESAIQVKPIGDSAVELTGKVRDMDGKRRALELAQSTVGVEKVMDRMEVNEYTLRGQD